MTNAELIEAQVAFDNMVIAARTFMDYVNQAEDEVNQLEAAAGRATNWGDTLEEFFKRYPAEVIDAVEKLVNEI